MIKKLALIGGVLGAFGFALPPDSAVADGVPTARVAPAYAGCAPGRFSGFYAGVNGGWAHRTFDTVEREIVGLSLLNDNDDGFTIGGQIGFNVQCGMAVWGIEADLNWADLDTTRDFSVAGFVPGLLRDERSMEWFGTLRTRAGIAADGMLLYITGGLAFADIQHRVHSPFLATTIFDSSDTRWGWTAGGGVEYALAPNITLKSEVLYVQFEDQGQSYTYDDGVDRFSVRFDDRDSMWVSRIGLNFKFGDRTGILVPPLK